MREHQFPAGEHIDGVVCELVVLANQHQESVKADFNGIELVANPGDNPAELLGHWMSERARRDEEYRNSPQGKRAKREAEERRRVDQDQVDRLMAILDEIDFTDVEPLIDWLDALCSPSDHIGVVFDRHAVIRKFADNGFQPDVYTGDEFVEGDREIYARYIIGQALSTLSGLGIHPLFHTFADRWREKFASANASC